MELMEPTSGSPGQTERNSRTESMRLKDLALTIELLGEAVADPSGARDRVAARHGIRKSVITNRVARMEAYFGLQLFGGPQRKTPTPAGLKAAEYGPRLLRELDYFAEMLRSTSNGDRLA